MTEKTVRLKPPEPIYTLFNAVRQGLPDVVVVNEALLAFTAFDVFPWHLMVRIEAKDIAENGMPSRAESDVLLDLAEKIEATLLDATTDQGAANVLFLARSTWNEQCELDYYVHDPEIAHEALQVLIKDPSRPRPWEYRMEADPNWEGAAPFFKLFPIAKGHDS
ncbi:MAG: DUF695 domain-containing protein [Kiloniellales bacterium]|nr:DUF695 domain-containing protein [Kiloniellales bacterium]